MKTDLYHSFNHSVFFKHNQKITRLLSVFLALCMLQLSTGCSYFKVREVPTTLDDMAGNIREFNGQRNYAIINQSWHLKNLTINEDAKTISGIATQPSLQHHSVQTRIIKKSYRYNSDQRDPFNELHFMVEPDIDPAHEDIVTIPFTDIQTITVNDKNSGRTVLNIAVGTIGVAVAVFLIALALKSSCPFVYIKEGEEYVFKGELYPGTITPGMQHLDYLPLPAFLAADNDFTVKVTNELKEKQYTDLLQLWVVDHKADTSILLDEHGQLQSFANLQPPQEIYNESGRLVSDALARIDGLAYTFNNEASSTFSTRELVMSFDRPASANHARLFLTAKNSLWLDYIFGKFNEQFGAYYNTFQKDQQQLSVEKSKQWAADQEIPLSVYLKTANGWEIVRQVQTVGPLAMRDLGMELDLENLPGSKIEIKISCGYMFWELDYAAIDYTENINDAQLTKLTPYMAVDENNNDVTALLVQADKQYLVQPEIGNAVTVNFQAPKKQVGLERSVFLVNQGYYNYIRDYKGVPNFEWLKKFREKNTFTRFSENSYKRILSIDQTAETTLNIQ